VTPQFQAGAFQRSNVQFMSSPLRIRNRKGHHSGVCPSSPLKPAGGRIEGTIQGRCTNQLQAAESHTLESSLWKMVGRKRTNPFTVVYLLTMPNNSSTLETHVPIMDSLWEGYSSPVCKHRTRLHWWKLKILVAAKNGHKWSDVSVTEVVPNSSPRKRHVLFASVTGSHHNHHHQRKSFCLDFCAPCSGSHSEHSSAPTLFLLPCHRLLLVLLHMHLWSWANLFVYSSTTKIEIAASCWNMKGSDQWAAYQIIACLSPILSWQLQYSSTHPVT
jgi:hypothetical protein